MVTLRKGSHGSLVKRLQRLLNGELKPSPNIAKDGLFGQETYKAVVRFQKERGLDPDGIVGDLTWSALGQSLPEPPDTASAASETSEAAWLEVAELELGVHEDSLPDAHNQRILEYHATTALHALADEVPWCSSFVNWVLLQAGFDGTNDALAASWLNWGEPLNQARVGAITVIKKIGATSDAQTGSSTGNHVGFLIEATPTHVRLLGGNQSDQVRYSNYPLDKWTVRGYRWPA